MERNNTLSNQAPITIHVIGVNPGGVKDLSALLQKRITKTKLIAAPKRILNSFQEWLTTQNDRMVSQEYFEIKDSSRLITWINTQENDVVVLASGDPLWFGIGRLLVDNIKNKKLSFHPSPTSLQLAFARLGRPWQDAAWVSLHGRDPLPLNKLLQKRPKALAILPDPNRGGAKEVRNFLKASETEDNYAFWVFENLGNSKESFQRIKPSEKIPDNLDPLHLVVLIEEKNFSINPTKLPLFGLEDGLFLQYDDRPGLMTKREIRIQILSDLELPSKGVIWDIGAGVGSIGIEALRIRPELKLISVEKRLGGKELIKRNAERMGVHPTSIIESEALDFLNNMQIHPSLCQPDRVVIGGGGEEKDQLIEMILHRMSNEGIVVIPLTTLQSLQKIEDLFNNNNCAYKISQHQSYRGVSIGNATRLSPMNPVFIIKGKLKK